MCLKQLAKSEAGVLANQSRPMVVPWLANLENIYFRLAKSACRDGAFGAKRNDGLIASGTFSKPLEPFSALVPPLLEVSAVTTLVFLNRTKHVIATIDGLVATASDLCVGSGRSCVSYPLSWRIASKTAVAAVRHPAKRHNARHGVLYVATSAVGSVLCRRIGKTASVNGTQYK